MGKILEISGTFQKNGEWVKPDPSFICTVVLREETCIFRGVCNDLYDAPPAPMVNPPKYIAGTMVKNKRSNRQRLMFFELSNHDDYDPLMYVFLDIVKDSASGYRAVMSNHKEKPQGIGFFKPGENAKVTVTEKPYSEKAARSIEAQYDEMDKSIPHNAILLRQLEVCKTSLSTATKSLKPSTSPARFFADPLRPLFRQHLWLHGTIRDYLREKIASPQYPLLTFRP